MTGVLTRGGEDTQTHTWSGEDRGRDRCDAATSQGTPAAPGRRQGQEDLAASLQPELGPETPRFRASGLRNGEGAQSVVSHPQFVTLCYGSPPGIQDNLQTHLTPSGGSSSRFARLSRRPSEARLLWA